MSQWRDVIRHVTEDQSRQIMWVDTVLIGVRLRVKVYTVTIRKLNSFLDLRQKIIAFLHDRLTVVWHQDDLKFFDIL